MTGKCCGGPLDGRVVRSNREYFEADQLPDDSRSLGAPSIVTIKLTTCLYRKVWRAQGQRTWYEWEHVKDVEAKT